MVKIDHLILGYRNFSVSQDEISQAVGILLRAKIPSSIKNGGTISVRERDYKKAQDLFTGKINFKISAPKGVYGIFKRTEKKKAILVGIILSLLLMFFSCSIIWDIRVDGNENITDSFIIEELEYSGFHIGKFFGLIDKSKVEHTFLKNNPEISWININRRGTIAYITVIENDNKNANGYIVPEGYSNIVASCNTVIEEITVKQGNAMVKPGDVVKKGDILISGVIQTESGTSFCYAEGSVKGRINEVISVELDREYTEKTEIKEKTKSLDLKIFDFSINIFKKYGKQPIECDIIDDIKSFSLFGKCKLPIELHRKRMVLYDEKVCLYTDAELVRAVSQMLNSKTASRLASSDLLKINTTGEFTDKGYRMQSIILFLSDVGTDSVFTVE